MTLPVSKYEELLETVRSLKRQTIRVRELASPLLDTIISANTIAPVGASSLDGSDVIDENRLDWCEDVEGYASFRATTNHRDVLGDYPRKRSTSAMDSIMVERQHKLNTQIYDDGSCSSHELDDDPNRSERHMGAHMSVSSDPESGAARNVSMLYHGTWPVERGMWNSEPPHLNHHHHLNQAEMTSVMSFASSSGAAPLDKVLSGECSNRPSSSQQHLEVKVDMVYSLLSMLGTQECPDMGETLLALSSSPESSLAMRQAGCLPVLVQLVYSEKDMETREKASQALYNLVQVQPDDKLKKRELKVWRLLEEIRTYCNAITGMVENENVDEKVATNHPSQVTENIIKLSFDEGYRQTICELGGIYSLAHLVEVDHLVHTESPEVDQCITLRRYAGMALTNLTFGHSQNKALLCSFRDFMSCLVVQLKSNSDELRQVTASVLRNLSWRADNSSRLILREVGSVPALMSAAIVSRKESTLKSILSALWNLSAHCSMNKADICSVEGSLGFLVDMLTYKAPSKTLTIIENVGGILRNVSSHIAVRDDYRGILREHNCLQVLLHQLKSPSLTIVSNACGTLWNISAKCAEDQKALWDLGAAPMLRSLNHSKHIMIATGSRAALKNLLGSRPSHSLFSHMDSTAKELGLPVLPTLGARKQRALAKDLDSNLAETCENIEPSSPPHFADLAHRKFKYPPKDEVLESSTISVTSHSKRTNHNDIELVETFSSLTLSDSNKSEFARKSQVYSPTSYNSLPYTSSTTSTPSSQNARSSKTYNVAVRNKYADCSFEDEPEQEEPVDYSRKYSESKPKPYTGNIKIEPANFVQPKAEPAQYVQCKVEPEPVQNTIFQTKPKDYSDYAETDLDQPTDYSLRYAENDSDSDLCEKTTNRSEFYEEQQDTIKTYCTEGTPYETPYNFSNATSMSDLRLDSNVEEDKPQKSVKKESELSAKEAKNEESTDLDTKVDTHVQILDKKICYSSGLITPEKPVNYCEEGTPGCFSRVSSFSSLNMEDPPAEQKSIKVEPISIKQETIVHNYNEPEVEGLIDEVKLDDTNIVEEASGAGKVVTFGRVVDYAEETPLMFSRCSSLGSLSSTEQHSIHDDRSSVISDFSRLTSGIISPSEIPDSPTQTVPPSPRNRKAPLEFPPCSDTPPRPTQKSVFEDNIIKFKEVNTPVEFSTNTSLSSLTIDDEPNIVNYSLLQNAIAQREETAESGTTESDTSMNKSDSDIDKSVNNESGSGVDLAPVSEGEEEEEDDMLAACINIGMQNNRHRQNKQQTSLKQRSCIPSALPKYNSKSPVRRTGIPVKSSSPQPARESRLPLSDSRTRPEIGFDTMRTYCTEDTPAILSNAGSQSDLSVLSISSKDKSAIVENDEKPDFSDDSSNLSGDNDNMLAECIQSGMPKARRQLVQPKIVTRRPPISRIAAPEAVSPAKTKIRPPTETNLQQRIFKNVAYISAKDEVESYAVEDSPCHFSLRSSLSDLTVDGSTAPIQRRKDDSLEKSANQISRDYDQFASPIYLVAGSSRDERNKSPETASFSNAAGYIQHTEEPAVILSRADSLSSLSVESYGSTENAEQALLEQCISSGMPKSKTSAAASAKLDTKRDKVIPNSRLTTSNNCVLEQSNSNSSNVSKMPIASTSSKNAYLASVVTSTTPLNQSWTNDPAPQRPQSPIIQTTGVATTIITDHTNTETNITIHNQDRLTGENSSIPRRKNGFDSRIVEGNLVIENTLNGFSRDATRSNEKIEKCDSRINRDRTSSEESFRLSHNAMESPEEINHLNNTPNQDGTESGIDQLNPISSPHKLSSGRLDLSLTSNEDFESILYSNNHDILMRNNYCSETTMDRLDHAIYRDIASNKNQFSFESIDHQNDRDLSTPNSYAKDYRIDQSINHDLIANYGSKSIVQNDRERSAKSICIDFSLDPSDDRINQPPQMYRHSSSSMMNQCDRERSSRTSDSINHSINNLKSSNFEQSANEYSHEYNESEDFDEYSTHYFESSPNYKPLQNIFNPSTNAHSSTLEENLLKGDSKSGYDVINKCSDLLLDGSVEDNASPELSDSEKNKAAQNRMLDPDAMIKSLDRFTAELVSQSSHLQHSQHDCKLENLMQSTHENGDTWNDDTSPNDVSFPSISISVPLGTSFKSDDDKNVESESVFETPDVVDALENPYESNQFSSLSTTMTDSTLIAMEATKIANVVRNEGNLMIQSVTSVTSFELDQVKPPSVMESLISLTSSASELKQSPLPTRKKSLPAGLMVRRALSHSSYNTKSLENLVDNASSVSSSCNLDHVKPPSVMGDYLDMIDMENSMISVASITSEVADLKCDFMTNGLVTKNISWVDKQPNIMSLLTNSTHCHSITDIENINPPSLLNEVTDMCNSIADIATDNLYSETEVFEDCFTHTLDQTLKNSEDLTEYSDANSVTPIQSDFATSSAESTPKKVKNLNRLTPKQRRQLAKERYKTYTVAAEMVIREEYKAKMEDFSPDSTSDVASETNNNSSSNSPTYATAQSPKLTPKEKRMMDRSRFQTRVLDGTFSPQFSPEISTAEELQTEPQSPQFSKLEIRKAMRQKRIENKDRFRTRTLSSDEISVSPELTPAPEQRIPSEDLHSMLEHEANLVLDTLKRHSRHDELLDCETLSLVSNEDESEHNSVSSLNYRTYHKSWGFSKNLPVVQSTTDISQVVNSQPAVVNEEMSDHSEQEQDEEEVEDPPMKLVKPKITKPEFEPVEEIINEDDTEPKGIRGRRKALYISPYRNQNPPSKLIPRSMKPIKNMTSNLVKNVTSTIKTTTANKLSTTKQIKAVSNPKPTRTSRLTTPSNSKITLTKTEIPKQQFRKPSPSSSAEGAPPKLERQGTFTKEDKKPSRIPAFGDKSKVSPSRIARVVGKPTPPIPKSPSKYNPKIQSKIISSTSKATESKSTFYSRSPSADRDFGYKSRKTGMHNSSSSQSLQSTDGTRGSYISKRSSIPNMSQRSNSNASITSTGSTGKKKPAVSKIAGLWKRYEDKGTLQKKELVIPKVRSQIPSSNIVKLREKKPVVESSGDTPKRLSRLGSFIQVEEMVA